MIIFIIIINKINNALFNENNYEVLICDYIKVRRSIFTS